jgi:hypothetical protein
VGAEGFVVELTVGAACGLAAMWIRESVAVAGELACAPLGGWVLCKVGAATWTEWNALVSTDAEALAAGAAGAAEVGAHGRDSSAYVPSSHIHARASEERIGLRDI